MKVLKKHKVAIIFYLVMIGLTFILSAKVEKLESKEDYNIYNKNIVMNNLK